MTKLHFIAPLLLACVSSASAAHLNDDFELGFSHWTTSGDVAIQTVGGNSVAVLTNAYTGGLDDPIELNLSGVNPTAAGGALETAAGLAVGALDLNAIDQATEGSVLWRTFTVTAGDTLSFDWQLTTRDENGTSYPDYAFVAINGTVFTLGGVNDATETATNPDYSWQTAINRYEHIFTADGTVKMAFGVVDVGDYSTSTALRLDNVSVVPEPTTALFGLALTGFAGLARRRWSTRAA